MLSRRGFLALGAGATAGLVASPIIWNTLYDAVFWTQNWSWIPRLQYGANDYVTTVSKLCPSGTGITVRLVEGRPVRVLGDPENPLSQGGLTALAAAETQLMVSPARLKKPLKRTPDGAHVEITWEQAQSLLLEKFENAGDSVACVSGDQNGTINELLSAILAGRHSADFYLMPFEEQPAAKAWDSMGGQGRIGYDIENADYILSLGADFLETWGTVVRNRKAFSAGKPAGEEKTLTVAYASPLQNNTAAGADVWLPCYPGTEGILALGLGNALIQKGVTSSAFGFGAYKNLVAPFTPEKTAELTGVPANRILAVAEGLMAASAPLVIAGSALGQGTCADCISAALALDLLLNRMGQSGGIVNLPYPSKVLHTATSYRNLLHKDFVTYCRRVKSGAEAAPKLFVLYEANPVYALPPEAGVDALFGASTFKIAFSNFMDESAEKADLILPNSMGVERFDDVYTPYGSGYVSYAIARPAIAPLYQTRPSGEILLALASELGLDFGVEDMPTLLAKKAQSLGADFDSMVEAGEVFVNEEARGAYSPMVFDTNALKKLANAASPADGLYVAAQNILGFGTPATGIPPFATRLITAYQMGAKYLIAQMNSTTAKKLQVTDGSLLRVKNAGQSLIAQVKVFEGVQNNVLAMPLGLGHTAFDMFSQNKGASLIPLMPVTEDSTGCTYGLMRVEVERV